MPIGGVVVAVAKKEKCQETSFQPTQPAKNQLSRLVCPVPRNCRLRVSAPKNDREERQRREEAKRQRDALQGHVPDRWLRLPLTDAHARELGQVLFFRGTSCLRGHLAPYRINGGCLACSGQTPSAHSVLIANSPNSAERGE